MCTVHHVQKERVQRSIARARGQPFEVGDLVRLRLTQAERSRRGGKISPVVSPLYKVSEVLRGFTASRLHGSGRRGDVKIRHYNDLVRPAATANEEPRRESDLETASSTVRDSGSSSEDDTDSEEHSRPEPAGRSPRPRRVCGPPSRLVVDPSRKRYEET